MFWESQPSSPSHSGVCMLVVSIQSPSSTWVRRGVLVSAEQFKVMHQTVIFILAGGPRSPVTLFSKLLTACACSLELREDFPESNQETEAFFLQTRSEGTGKGFCIQKGAAGSCSVSLASSPPMSTPPLASSLLSFIRLQIWHQCVPGTVLGSGCFTLHHQHHHMVTCRSQPFSISQSLLLSAVWLKLQ